MSGMLIATRSRANISTGDFPEVGGPGHLLHFGTALKLAKQHQIDFHVGVGLSSAAVDHLIGVGYSFRF